MKILLTALLLGCVSMVVVFISGFTSGVVRLTTLAIRTIFAFAMTSAASYFLIMLFDYYEEIREKKLKKELEANVTEETPLVEEVEEQSSQSENVFQPITAENLPNVEK